jgi:arsenate reductase-like glutaredoxin family protein
MTEITARLLLVVAVLGVAGVVAFAANRIQKPPHPTLSVQIDGDRPGVVLFTSLECTTCKETISLLRSKGVPFREITHELEPQRFESWRVLAVPLTVVLDSEGTVVAALSGAPSSRSLAGALRAANIKVSH